MNDACPYLLIAGIIVLGVALRLYGLRGESAWWDEYTSLMHLDAPNLWRFLQLNRTLDPATLPLYYAIEYLWWHGVNASVLGLRYLSILLGMAAVPLLYLLGKTLYGRTAGLTAALLLSLSPVHTFHDQGIRMYVLLNLLALMSAYTFVRTIDGGGRRWWAAHLAANFLLTWTHPFALLLLVVEGLFLLLFRWRQMGRVVLWTILNGLLALPSLLYLLTVRFWPKEQTQSWFNVPSPLQFIADVFGDDVISMTYQLRISEQAWTWLPDGLPRLLAALRPACDVALLAVPCICIAGLVWRAYLSAPASDAPAPRKRAVEPLALLLLWLVVPPLALYVASYLWRPCIFPRYTLYSSLALYLIIGGFVASWRSGAARAGLVAAAVLLYGYQIGLVHPGPQRTDWQGAARIVQEQGQPGDVVLVEVSIWRDVFLYNLGPSSHPVAFAATAPVLAEQAAFVLDYYAHAAPPESRPRGVWVIIATRYFDSGPDTEFEAALASHGLTFSLTERNGIEHLLVYHVTPGPAPAPLPPLPEDAVPPEYTDGYGDLAMALVEQGDHAAALAALRRVFEADPGPVKRVYGLLYTAIETGEGIEKMSQAVRALLQGYLYRASGNNEAAVEAFEKAIALAPGYAAADSELAKLLTDMGRYEEALGPLREAVASTPSEAILYGHLAGVIAQGGDAKRAIAAVRLLLQGLQRHEAGDMAAALDALRQATWTDDAYGAAHFLLGTMYLEVGDEEEGRREMQRGFALDRNTADLWEPLYAALFDAPDFEKACAEEARLRELNLQMPQGLRLKFAQDFGRTCPETR